jgi:exopolyphosphatase/guanosine-5'-triphosphate,3'-diphosphate pyrophosphatase
VRRRSVIELAERCGYWPVHAQQVARLALQIFDATRDLHGLGAREREWLEFGALLHDIGIHISYEGHHKHSYYLVRNGGLRGFEPQEITIIGLITRYHRQGTPKKLHDGFADLPGRKRDTVTVLGAMLRIAEGLDRSHAQVVDRVFVTVERKRIRFRLRITGDAELELWAAHRHTGPLAKLFEREIVVETGTRARKARSTSKKDAPRHAQYARGPALVPRPAVRRRRHRRLRQDDAARLAS